MENWKAIPNFEGYEASDHGRVRSIDRMTTDSKGHKYKIYGKVKYFSLNKKGYPQVILWRSNKTTTKRIHRFVAELFIPNPDDLPQVNHKDGNKQNNHFSNLEWCTNQYNQLHAWRTLGLKRKSGANHAQSKSVYQLSYDGFFIAEHGSIAQAQKETGVAAASIRRCALGSLHRAGNFKWAF